MIELSELHARTKTSLVYKYAFVFMVGALIPVILLGLWSFWMSYKSMHLHISESVYQVLKEKIDYTTLILQEAESLIANISGVEEISRTLKYETDAETDFNRLQLQAKIGYILSNYINIPGLESIDIFSAKGVQYHVGDTLLPKTNEDIQIQVQKIIAENEAGKKSITWHGIRPNLNNPSQYSLIASKRLISIDPETMQENFIGIIIIHYSVDAFNRKFAKSAKPGITHLVIDTQGNCIYSPLSETIGQPFHKYNRLDKFRPSDNFTYARYNGKKVYMLKFNSQLNNWTYYALLHPEYLRGVSRNFTNGTVILLLLVLTVISTINVSYFRHMLQPIKEITNGLQGISNGTYDLEVKLPNPHKDEIGELIRWFNNFTDDLIEKDKYRKELIQQKELAEKASEAKTVFLASISHELRTPLNGIIAIAELLDRTDLNSEQRDFLHTILQSSDILYALINHVLDYSKIASDKMELNPTVFDLLPLCEKLSHIYSSQAQIKQIGYVYTKPELPSLFVYADEIGIQKVLINLLGNALKFTTKGNVAFDVSLDSITEESVSVRFTVSDTGIGVVPEKQKLIFQAFEQADSDLAKSFEGSGLGLSIAQQLAKMMKSEVTLLSPNPKAGDEFGPGSVFSFVLCLPRTIPNADPASMDKAIRASKTMGTSRTLACLIVEDNPINQRVLSSMLKKFNAESVVASNWEQCMAVIDQKNYDYIFMDIQMPGKTGLEITEMIRAKGLKTPIIAITGNALKEIEERAYACGMNAFLVKPIRNSELEDVIFRFYPQT